MLLAVVCPSLSLIAGSKPNNTLEPMDVADPSESTGPTASAAPTSSTPAEAVTVNYSGEIRRYPAGGGPAVYGTLSLAISPLGKVTGSIHWYQPDQTVKIGGKQDLNTRQGDFIIRDANGAKVPGALRLPFRISKKNRLVGGGILASGEASSFRLNREASAAASGNLSEGGATLSLGTNTYSGASSATINTGTLTTLNNSSLGSGALTVSSGLTGSASTGSLAGLSIANLGTGALTLTGNNTLTVTGSASAVLPTINAAGNLLLGNTVLLLGPVTTTTGTDGTITYTGTYTSGAAGTVIVQGTANGG